MIKLYKFVNYGMIACCTYATVTCGKDTSDKGGCKTKILSQNQEKRVALYWLPTILYGIVLLVAKAQHSACIRAHCAKHEECVGLESDDEDNFLCMKCY